MSGVEEAPRAAQFIGWIADRFVEKHIPPLEREKALAMAWGALDFIEQQGAVFGHLDYDWSKSGAVTIADDEIEHWEPAR